MEKSKRKSSNGKFVQTDEFTGTLTLKGVDKSRVASAVSAAFGDEKVRITTYEIIGE